MSTAAQLGYLGLEVSDLGPWRAFATDLLGLEVGEPRSDGAALMAMRDRLVRAGVPFQAGSAAEVAARGVHEMIVVEDLDGVKWASDFSDSASCGNAISRPGAPLCAAEGTESGDALARLSRQSRRGRERSRA